MRNNDAKRNKIHAQIEKNMTRSQVIMSFETCLNYYSRLKCRLVSSLNLLLSFACTMAHCTRSESDCMEHLVCNFFKELPVIGPKEHVASCGFSNGGKSNAPGELNYNGSVAHSNSMQHTDVLKGMNCFFRWSLSGEAFPDFALPCNYHNVPALRKDIDETTSINYQLLNNKHHLLCEIIGFRNGSKG